MEYVPLHVHSDASLDGAGTVQSLVKRASEMGLKGLGLTDHGTLGNAISFWSACTDADIKPIMGVEAYLLYKAKRHHITLLALNEAGFNNLVYLNTEAHVENYSGGYPLVTLDNIEKHAGGILALTGCASSALYEGELSDGAQYVGDLVDALGRGKVVLETMFLGAHNTWSRPLELSQHMNMPYVITNDTHYPCQEQFPAHQVITKARRGFTYDSQHLWLKSADEIYQEASKWVVAPLIVGGLATSLAIYEMVEQWDMRSKPTLPHIPEVEETLKVMLNAAFKNDTLRRSDKAARFKRLEYEYKILKDKGFLDYVYILWDIVRWAKNREIMVGPARGSGGGSYVLYLLGITSIDPIEFGLIFERFINPSRADYPDVDVDFESDRRHEVMEYAREKWSTIPICTYSTYSHKSAVHDIARILTIPKDMEDPAADSGQDSEAFTSFISDKADALVAYNTMIGQIRHRGKHAAGVIITDKPVPIERTSSGELAAAWAEGTDTKYLSQVGIVKYDLLGLTALSQLKMMRELTGELPPTDFNDPAVFDLFCNGDVAGIFQWSGSEGIRNLTMQVSPRNFYDLATCNALYRPGALNAGTAEHYPEFMRSPRRLHPRIDKHLEKTYGVICYQEQVMSVVAEVMGGDLSMAENARKLLSKAAVGDPKWEEAVDNFQSAFLKEGVRQGFDEGLLSKLWGEVYTHSGYSYNLAHASAYTMTSYRMAWYKVYYRPAFTVAVLQYDRANAQTYILDAVQHGLKVETPHILFSTDQYRLFGEKIYVPLSDIAFLGDKAVQCILEEQKKGPLATYEEFAKRIPKKVCNSRARGMLERIGAFRGLLGDPKTCIDKYEDLPITDKYETQLEILGYVIPTKTLYRNMQELRKRPAKKGYTRYAGFVSKVSKKKSAHGPYTVYTLSPPDSFWIREDEPSFSVGQFISGTKSKFGHSTNTQVYRLGSRDGT